MSNYSLLGLWAESVVSDVKATFGYKPNPFKKVASNTTPSNNDVITRHRLLRPYVTNKVDDNVESTEAKNNTVESTPVQQQPKTIKVEIVEQTSICNTDWSKDNIDSFIINNCHNEGTKAVALVSLALGNYITMAQLTDQLVYANEIEMVNSIYHFLGSQAWSQVNVSPINEIVSKEDALATLRALCNVCGERDVFKSIIFKFENEYDAAVATASVKEDAGITKENIIFTAEELGYDKNGNPTLVPEILPPPRLTKKTEKKLNKIFSEILGNGNFTVEAMDSADFPGEGRDTGMAILNCQAGSYIIDLGGVYGNGFAIINPTCGLNLIRLTDAKSQYDLIKAVLLHQPYVVKGTEKPFTSNLFKDERLYKLIDFSNFSLLNKSVEEVMNFESKLVQVHDKVNWNEIMGTISAAPTRFRILNYKDPEHFTLVSDKEVRVPFPYKMYLPYHNIYGKFYINRYDKVSNDVLRLVIDGPEYRVYINNEEIIF